jgi:hypothetical protein
MARICNKIGRPRCERQGVCVAIDLKVAVGNEPVAIFIYCGNNLFIRKKYSSEYFIIALPCPALPCLAGRRWWQQGGHYFAEPSQSDFRITHGGAPCPGTKAKGALFPSMRLPSPSFGFFQFPVAAHGFKYCGKK